MIWDREAIVQFQKWLSFSGEEAAAAGESERELHLRGWQVRLVG